MNTSNYPFQKQTQSIINNHWSPGGIYMQNTNPLHSVCITYRWLSHIPDEKLKAQTDNLLTAGAQKTFLYDH